MSSTISPAEIQQFYNRWAPTVLIFCLLYLGDEDCAQTAAERAFLAYVESEAELDCGRIPVFMLRSALETSQHWIVIRDDSSAGDSFEELVLNLPERERAVFLLHSIIGLDFQSICAVNGFAFDEQVRLWGNAIVRLGRCVHENGTSSDLAFSEATELPASAGQC